MYKLIDKNLVEAIDDAGIYDKYIFKEVYLDNAGICGNKIPHRRGYRKSTKEILKRMGCTNDDFNIYDKLAENNKYDFCVLPKNHYGKCKNVFSTQSNDRATGKSLIFNQKFIDDIGTILNVHLTPGESSKSFFYNRAQRTFPYLLSRDVHDILKNEQTCNQYGKINGSEIFVPIDQAATPKMCSSVVLDLNAYLFYLCQDEVKPDADKNIIKMLERHVEMLKIKNPMSFGKKTSESKSLTDGRLSCVIRISFPLSKEMLIEKNRNNDDKIEFGHLKPVRNNAFMTRGLNICLITSFANKILNRRDPYNDIDSKEIKEKLDQFYIYKQ